MPLADGLYQRRSEKSIGSPVFWFNFQRLRGGIAPSLQTGATPSAAQGQDQPAATGIKRRSAAPATA
jgi:hypothetical protein